MLYNLDAAAVTANFYLHLKKDGKVVDRREVHNVFTNTGRNWLSRLVAWYALGSPDTPYTNRRVRWIGLGTGVTQLELVSVQRLETPAKVDDSNYLAALQGSDMDPDGYVNTIRFSKEFGPTEVSIPSNPVVPVTEAGLFVDVYKVSGMVPLSHDDSAAPGYDSTLDPTSALNAPVAYARFDPVTKTQDFSLEMRWDFRFGHE